MTHRAPCTCLLYWSGPCVECELAHPALCCVSADESGGEEEGQTLLLLVPVTMLTPPVRPLGSASCRHRSAPRISVSAPLTVSNTTAQTRHLQASNQRHTAAGPGRTFWSKHPSVVPALHFANSNTAEGSAVGLFCCQRWEDDPHSVPSSARRWVDMFTRSWCWVGSVIEALWVNPCVERLWVC